MDKIDELDQEVETRVDKIDEISDDVIEEALEKATMPCNMPGVNKNTVKEGATYHTDKRFRHPNKGKKRLSGLVDSDLFKIVTTRMTKGDKDQSSAFKRILEEFAEYEKEGRYTFDDAAELLLKTLDPTLIDWMKEIAHERRVPVWQVIMGLVKLASERSEITCFIIEPGWNEPEVFFAESICPKCRKEFPPTRLGQIFCSNACSATRKTDKFEKSTSIRNIIN